jgi:hypothetical protein
MAATATQLEDLLSEERNQLERDGERVRKDREALEKQREELIQQRMELERLRAEVAGTPPGVPSTRDTWLDAKPDARLESARRLLRELAERRQAKSEKAE